VLGEGVDGGGRHADDGARHAAQDRQHERFGEELFRDVAAAGAQGPAQADLGAAFENGDDGRLRVALRRLTFTN
jgi:hypothetical protein